MLSFVFFQQSLLEDYKVRNVGLGTLVFETVVMIVRIVDDAYVFLRLRCCGETNGASKWHFNPHLRGLM